jgi:hypothetical protein
LRALWSKAVSSFLEASSLAELGEWFRNPEEIQSAVYTYLTPTEAWCVSISPIYNIPLKQPLYPHGLITFFLFSCNLNNVGKAEITGWLIFSFSLNQ